MNIIKSIVTQSDCYKTGQKITVKGLMLHSVGCNQPSAQVFVNSWNKSGKTVCCHGLIDGNTGDVYQTLPWNHRGWHCAKSGNNTHISVEMCEPSHISVLKCVNLQQSSTQVALLGQTLTLRKQRQL